MTMQPPDQPAIRLKPTTGTAEIADLWDLAPRLLAAAQTANGRPEVILETLASSASQPPTPGEGRTVPLWEFLATVGAIDLSAARTLEPHLDAAAILSAAGHRWAPGTKWGVFAAESPSHRLEATVGSGEQTVVNGTKPWCSLADRLDHALVTGWMPDGSARRLFAVDLRDPRVRPLPNDWPARGLSNICSGPTAFDQLPVTSVGGDNWYLDRPGFAWGGIGVAAIWFGGAVGLVRSLRLAATRREPDQLALVWLGRTHRILASCAALLHDAATRIDHGDQVGWADALTVRGHVWSACSEILDIVGEALGPGPLTQDEVHARRVADLAVYLRQHHGSRDDAGLGKSVLTKEVHEF